MMILLHARPEAHSHPETYAVVLFAAVAATALGLMLRRKRQ
ncbi:MAG TPA: hypothetical protein VGF69_16610 [Thermoanaerobaculia bacterium]